MNVTPLIDVLLVLLIIFHGDHTIDATWTRCIGAPAEQG